MQPSDLAGDGGGVGREWEVKRFMINLQSAVSINTYWGFDIKKKSHRWADACIPRTSHFRCSFVFARALHNWKKSGETEASFTIYNLMTGACCRSLRPYRWQWSVLFTPSSSTCYTFFVFVFITPCWAIGKVCIFCYDSQHVPSLCRWGSSQTKTFSTDTERSNSKVFVLQWGASSFALT